MREIFYNKPISEKNRKRFIQLGTNIAVLRKNRGLSRQQLEEKAGISHGIIKMMETPELIVNVNILVVVKIANALNVNLSELFNNIN